MSIPALVALKARAAKKAKAKAKAKRLKLRQNPPLAKLKKILWTKLSAMIKANNYPVCYSCGAAVSGSNNHAGHLFSAGSHSLIRFWPDNLRPQCFRCNISLRGNGGAFAAHYVRDRGAEKLERLERWSRVGKKWTRDEISLLIDAVDRGLEYYETVYWNHFLEGTGL